MDARPLAALLALALLSLADFSLAGSRIVERLDGITSVTTPPRGPSGDAESPLLADKIQASPYPSPRGHVSPEATTPFGAPLPPNQLTPPPVLPFNPNRSLMPSPSSPSPSPGSGRAGR